MKETFLILILCRVDRENKRRDLYLTQYCFEVPGIFLDIPINYLPGDNNLETCNFQEKVPFLMRFIVRYQSKTSNLVLNYYA